MVKIERALISVSDKTGLTKFARGLHEAGVELISTGGTAKAIEKAGIPVRSVSSITKFPEMLDGRVKTLHPKIHGGILADRSKKSHLEQLKDKGIKPIDMVVVNLYPFRETVAKPKVTLDEAIENIDIGGPTMIRSAAKNFKSVAVVVNSDRYTDILAEMKAHDGKLSQDTRFALAKEAFVHTAEYDAAISSYLAGGRKDLPEVLTVSYRKLQALRYGENPHQRAAYYRSQDAADTALVNAKQLQGKELSYNNILDLEAAWRMAMEYDEPTAVVIKHNNASGLCCDPDILKAYVKAHAADPLSAFGSVVGFNRKVSTQLAKTITKTFVEAVIAPGFDQGALDVFAAKTGMRILQLNKAKIKPELEIRSVYGGILVQDRDIVTETKSGMTVVTTKKPTAKQWDDLLFAWKLARHTKSNAIVLAKNKVAVGVGAGQMSRVVSAEIAAKKAGDRAKGCVVASDAFFPFRDGIDAAARVGAAAVIQPGGSVGDDEVIAAANEHGMSMVFTGRRHFFH